MAAAGETAFKVITLEWTANMLKAKGPSPEHIERTTRRLEVHFFPWLGHKPIATVTDDDVLACIRRIERAKLIDTAHRALASWRHSATPSALMPASLASFMMPRRGRCRSAPP